MPKDKKKLSIRYPSLINRNSSRSWRPLSRVNITGLLRGLQVKIENIYLFKILIKKMTTSLKAGFAQIFSCCPKNLSCPKLGGGVLQAPSPPPPRPYAYVLNALTFQVSMHVQKTINDYVSRHQNYKFCLHSCKIPVPLRKKKTIILNIKELTSFQ